MARGPDEATLRGSHTGGSTHLVSAEARQSHNPFQVLDFPLLVRPEEAILFQLLIHSILRFSAREAFCS